MLFVVAEHGPVKPDDHFVGDAVGAAADSVGDEAVGEVGDSVAGIPGALAPVHVFAIHEEVRVEAADFLDKVTAHKHGGSADPIYIADGGVIPVLHEIVADGPVVGEKATEEGVSERGGEGVGEAAAAVLEAAVGIEEFGAGDTDVGVFGDECEEFAEGTGVNDGIAVEEGDVASAALPDGEVVSAGEAEVFGLAEEADPREFALDHFGAPVYGGVFDDDDFEVTFGAGDLEAG